MRTSAVIVCGGLLALCVSCTEYTPKPRGYFRIEPPAPSYQALAVKDLPYTFRLSRWAEVELPPAGSPAGWINLSYPQLNVKLYCSYLPVTSATLGRAEEECRALVVRQAKYPDQIKVQTYSNPEASVYGSLFMLDGEFATAVYVDRQCLPLFPGSFVLRLYPECRFAGSRHPIPETGYRRTDPIF